MAPFIVWLAVGLIFMIVSFAGAAGVWDDLGGRELDSLLLRIVSVSFWVWVVALIPAVLLSI